MTDWADATHLHILKRGYGIHYGGDDVIADSAVVVLDSEHESASFNEGVVHMGTTFATDAFDETATSWEPPHVELDWSCGVSIPPHFQVIEGLPQAYAIRLSSLGYATLGLSQRIKMRIHGSMGFATLELEGRSHDAIQIPIAASGNNWTFDYADGGSIGIDAAGTISSSGSNKVVDFDRLILRGNDLGTPTWTLTQFAE